MNFDCAGRRVLVSAGASGIGAEIARALAEAGAHVQVCDINADRLATFAAERPEIGTALCDVSDEGAVARMVDAAAERLGGLDALVNNAGISGPTAPIEATDSAAWMRTYDVNVHGTFFCTRAAVPHLRRAGGGSIVNLSSVSGLIGNRGIHVGYNASKGAVRLLTKGIAVQHGRDGIRANSVHPGLMPPMITSGRTADPAQRAKMLKSVPLGRAGEVDEVANAILFLASDESSYVTGTEMVVDGGWTAS